MSARKNTRKKRQEESSDKPFSVAQYIERLNEALGSLSEDIVGEVSEVKLAPSGHVYFTLKDKDTGDILPCAIWKFKYQYCGVELEIGMEVLLKGKPTFSGRFGRLSFIADSVSLVGEGALKKAYDKLKKKLAEEGLFDEARKRPLPAFPKTIGVITSVHGAVIHDFSNNLRRSGFRVRILDCRVEGPECGPMLALSVRAMRSEKIDALVLIRGGGSMQSLAGFDNEALVREIARFPVPVLAGIGHHQDVPLAALVADAAESTPSLVAALLGRSWTEAERAVERSERRILESYAVSLREARQIVGRAFRNAQESLEGILEAYSKAKGAVTHGFQKIEFRLKEIDRDLSGEAKRVTLAYESSLGATRAEYFSRIPVRLAHRYRFALERIATYLTTADRLIQTNNPERQLKLGYSIAWSGGKVVRRVQDAKVGQQLEVRVIDGDILTEVKGVK